MDPIRFIAFASAAPAVLWVDPPLPRGWNRHLPLPAHPHTVVIGGLPGWHTTLMVVMAAVLAAAVVVVLTRPRQSHAAPQPTPGPLQPQPERRPPQ